MPFAFTILHRDGWARLGTLETPHGTVQTPAFMAVGTRGSLKGVTPEQARACGCQMILGNTYTRRGEGVSIWVVKSSDIVASQESDSASFYDPQDDKPYRHATFYKVPDEVSNL